MALNDLIAQGAQFKQPDLLQQYGAMQHLQSGQQANQLNQMKMQEMQRGVAEQEQVRNFLRTTPNFDPMNPTHQAGLTQVAPTIAPKLIESWLTTRKTGADIGKVTADTKASEFKLTGEKADKAISDIAAYKSAEDAIAGVDRHQAAGELDPQKAAQVKSMIQNDPNWQVTMQLGILEAKDRIKATAPDLVEIRAGDVVHMVDKNPNSPTYKKTVSTTTIGQSADNKASVGATYAGIKSTAKTAANALDWQKDVAGQANLAAAKTTATETAKADVELTTAQKQDKAGATKALREINYNPKTKTDDILKLIDQSTSGWGQHLASGAVGAVTGSSTSGKAAIAQLAAMANKMTLDIMGGKLGAGISNTDRDFIVGELGSVADPTIPSNARKAAWKKVQERLVKSATGDFAAVKPAPTIHDQADAILGIK